MTGQTDILYRTLFDVADNALIILDEGIIVHCNEACLDLFGATDYDYFIGKPPAIISPEHQKDGSLSTELAQKMIDKCLKQGYHKFPWIHKKLNQELFDTEVSLTRFMNEGRTLILAVIRNITDILNAENSLQFAEEKLRLIAQNTDDLIWIRDLKFRYTYLSPSVHRLKGYTVEEALKLGPTQTVHRSDIKAAFKALKEELEKEKDPKIKKDRSRRFQMREYHKNGEIIWTEQSMSFIRDLNDKPIGFIGITRDISEQKRIEEELITAKMKAEESDALKSSFLANMSHEIRTPLNAILGFSDLILDESLSLEERSQFSGIIRQSSDRLIDIISDIFDISKLETNQMDIQLKACNLAKLFNQFSNYPATLDADITTGVSYKITPAPAWAQKEYLLDQIHINQIIKKLLHNAFKFSSSGTVEISLRKNVEGMARISVRDEGPGITETHQEVIFQRFRQGQESYDRKHGGTGLGLAICKGLVELMGGKIGVHSQPELGSEFWFSFPLNPA